MLLRSISTLALLLAATTTHTYPSSTDFTVKVRVTDSSSGTTDATTVVTAP